MVKALVHYAEIGLKGKNIGFFEDKLIANIKLAAARNKIKLKDIKKENKRIIAEFDAKESDISPVLKNTFGIKYFSYITEVKSDIEEIRSSAAKLMKNIKDKIAFSTKRADKDFPLTSPEVNKELGEIANKHGLKVDYENAEDKIFIEIMKNKTLIYTERIEGYGGLPVGTSGKVLCLLSGGIDSPVAAWNMMRRGCEVDFLHVHTFRNNTEAEKSKITQLIKALNNYQLNGRLYLVPYSTYEVETLGRMPPRYDLVFFKHYILKLAEALAEKEGYDVVVTGDNLAQVASQTMENLKAASTNIKIPIFRPLLTYEKEEIINRAEEIGTYKISIEAYKDCCSILAKKPATKTKPEKFEAILKEVDVDKIVEKSLKEI